MPFMKNFIDLAVIGGGASGMLAAIHAASILGQSTRICVLERLPRVGKKLSATGNGRCNITNMNANPKNYHGTDRGFVSSAMQAFPPQAVRDYLGSLGICTKEELDGKVYPTSDQASSVLDVLRLSLAAHSVDEICDYTVNGIQPIPKGFVIQSKKHADLIAKSIIWAAGGQAAPNLGGSESGLSVLKKAGYKVTPCYPSIVQLKTETEAIRPLKGIKYNGKVSIYIGNALKQTEVGEVLFAEYGLSGPAILQLSRVASEALTQNPKADVRAHLQVWPQNLQDTLNMLKQRANAMPERTLENFLTGMLNKRLGQTLVKLCGGIPLSRPVKSLSDGELKKLAQLLRDWPIRVVGTQTFAQAQATAGGIRTDCFDAKTMQSRLHKGLFACGEVLDIDGDCGGYNLQWAWASGLTAGQNAAQFLRSDHQ